MGAFRDAPLHGDLVGHVLDLLRLHALDHSFWETRRVGRLASAPRLTRAMQPPRGIIQCAKLAEGGGGEEKQQHTAEVHRGHVEKEKTVRWMRGRKKGGSENN